MDEKYYSIAMDIKAAAAMLSDCDGIYNSAVLDVGGDASQVEAFLDDIISRSDAFMDANKVWDQDVLRTSINEIINKREDLYVYRVERTQVRHSN